VILANFPVDWKAASPVHPPPWGGIIVITNENMAKCLLSYNELRLWLDDAETPRQEPESGLAKL
jgi:hypothetical protein